MLQRLRAWAKAVTRELRTLYLATGDPRTPWYARALALAVVAYAVSPIDLIPDVIPVLGLLDDALLLPLGVLLVRRLIPGQVLTDARAAVDADEAGTLGEAPGGPVAAALMVLAWLAAAAWLVYLARPWIAGVV